MLGQTSNMAIVCSKIEVSKEKYLYCTARYRPVTPSTDSVARPPEIETVRQGQSGQRPGLSHDDRETGGTVGHNIGDSMLW